MGVTTRSMEKKQARLAAFRFTASVFVNYIHEKDEYDWVTVFHPRRIPQLPKELRDVATESIRYHDVFNWYTGERGCDGWIWNDVMDILTRELSIDIGRVESFIGHGNQAQAHGAAAWTALQGYVQNMNRC